MIIRELFAKLGLSVDAASFAIADQMLGAVKSGLGLLVSGTVQAGEGLAEIVTKTVETAGALNDTSIALGVTTDAIQELVSDQFADSKPNHLSLAQQKYRQCNKIVADDLVLCDTKSTQTELNCVV